MVSGAWLAERESPRTLTAILGDWKGLPNSDGGRIQPLGPYRRIEGRGDFALDSGGFSHSEKLSLWEPFYPRDPGGVPQAQRRGTDFPGWGPPAPHKGTPQGRDPEAVVVPDLTLPVRRLTIHFPFDLMRTKSKYSSESSKNIP